MGGVWWRPEPCRCLSRHFLFCVDASVPVPSCSLVAGLVRVVSAAVILGSSGFVDTSGFLCFFAVASVVLSAVSFDTDGSLHTVVVLQLLLLLMLPSEDIFWPHTLLHGILSLEDFACLVL